MPHKHEWQSRCPTCAKILKVEMFHGLAMNRCPDCRGIWLAEGQLGRAAAACRSPQSPVPHVTPSSDERACPGCGHTMTPFNYAHDSGVFIDKCASCAGVWLNDGQLEQIARYRQGTPAVQALGHAWTAKLRHANRWQFARQILRSRFLSAGVGIVYLVFLLSQRPAAVQRRVPWRTIEIPDEPAARYLHILLAGILMLSLPLTCIWFADAIGNRRDRRRVVVPQSPPGDLLALSGWLLLLAYGYRLVMWSG